MTDMFSDLPHSSKEFEGYCISESVDHPSIGDYFLTIRSAEEKYVMRAEIDWDRCQLKKIHAEHLFPVAEEKLSLDPMSAVTGAKGYFHDMAMQFIETNLKFRKRTLPELLCIQKK